MIYLFIDQTKKLGISAENTLRVITLLARAKCKIENWNGKSSLTSAKTNSNVQSRNIQARSARSIKNRNNSNS